MRIPSQEVWARAAVLAVPPKLLAERVTFDPPLDPSRASAMRDSRTWMVRRQRTSMTCSMQSIIEYVSPIEEPFVFLF